MAVPDLEKIVKIVFRGDDTDIGKTITSVEGGLNTLAGKVGTATEPFAKLTDSIVKIDAALAALAVGSLIIATKTAGEFADSFAEISTLIDVPTEKLGEFSDSILDYATTSTQSIEDINKSIYDAISAGEDYTTALKLLEAAEQLGIATKADLNTAINLLKPTLNAFGESTASAADFADILFTTVKTGKTTLDELAPVLGNVTSIAAQAGVPFEDLAAAVAALTASGVGTSEAVTQLKAALTAIVAPSVGAKTAAEELGVQLGQEAIAADGLDGVLRNLIEATGGNIDQLKQIVPRVEALNAVLILGKDASGIFAGALEAMENRAGNASEAYAKMADNFELVNQRLINNIKAALIEIGEPLLDEWAELAKGIVNILRGIEDEPIDWGDVFGPLTALAEELLSDLAGYFNDIAKVLPEALEGIDWTGFTNAIKDLVDTGKQLFSDLLGGLDLTKAEDLEAAIQKVVDTFTNWVKLTEGLVEGLKPFLLQIANLISKFSEMDAETVKSIGVFTGWGDTVNTIANFIPNLTGALNLLSASIGLLSITRIPAAITAMGGFGTAATTLLGGAMTPLLAGATALAGGWAIGSTIGKDIPILGEAGTAAGNLAFAIANLGDDTVGAMEKQAAHTAELARAAVEAVRTKEAAGELASQLKEIPEATPMRFETNFDAVQEDFVGINAEIEKAINAGDIEIDATLKDEGFTKTWEEIKIITEEGGEIIIQVPVDKPVADAKTVNAEVDKALTDKQIEIKLQGEIDIELERIRTKAETLQTFFEWQAKIEIAQIEKDAEIIIGIADNIGKAFESTGDVISAALGVLTDDLSAVRWLDVIKIIDREQDLREKLGESLIKLQEAQIKILEARALALKEGKGIIQITTDGIEPELEQVLYSIIQKAQVKANEEGFNALLGI